MDASRSITEQDLAQFPIFAALDKKLSERAVARARIINLDRGDHLFHQGDPAQ